MSKKNCTHLPCRKTTHKNAPLPSVFLEELPVDRPDHGVESRSDRHQPRHGVHRVVVDERGGVQRPRRHQGHLKEELKVV